MYWERFENNRDYQIRNKAIKLLEMLKIDTSSAIDISKVIKLMKEDITWKIVDLDGLPGFTCYNRKKNKYKIFLDEETSERCLERIIFTMAHELGHIVLGHFNAGKYDDSTCITNRRLEEEANIFADELLMPTSHIINKNMTPEQICKTYLVSESAARNKIKYIQRNTIYRETKQITSLISRYIDSYEASYRRKLNAYNERVLNDYLEKWLDPEYVFW
ncbi:ImmA/IrrE family metallo-endopeptidase [Thermoclostridium stercorarium]|uniref:ImmA/IrrE family metallo-endopeptidase n=1 Tax=Thermoclostridium stercorarium TaxID=1510 RepID=UPI0022489406|nr:ImmA/IrrE family metallo-endopeptidase [Thermoclostridium stercorarium]UZQ85085.1 ImmA/IrrE family metallo-endopeptidase [Thermoclostridium stercorarium]